MNESLTLDELMALPDGEREQRLEALRLRSRELEREVFELRINARLDPSLCRISTLEEQVRELRSKGREQ